MKWFKHSGTLRHDPKVKRLIREYGSDGYCVYMVVVESISESLDPISKIIPYLEEDASDIAYEFKIDSDRVRRILDFCIKQGLLEESTTGYIFCFKLYKYVDEYFTKNKKNQELHSSRNREIINAYKNGGLAPMLLCLKELAPSYSNQIGQIKIDGLEQLQSNSRVSPDFIPLEEKRREEIRLEENRIEEKNTKKEKPKYINYQPQSEQDSLSSKIQKAINHWNDKDNLLTCKYLITSLPKITDIRTKFDTFELPEIITAIDNLSKAYESLDQKYRPKNFQNFICNSLDNWFEEMETEKPKPKYRTAEERRYFTDAIRIGANEPEWLEQMKQECIKSLEDIGEEFIDYDNN